MDWRKPRTAPWCASTCAAPTSRSAFASEVNAFCAEHLNPYVDCHRPCLFAKEITNKQGKIARRYPQRLVMTPFGKLARIAKVETILKPGITLQALRANATSISDDKAAAQTGQVVAHPGAHPAWS